jgi:hypothetical protein
VVADVDCFVDDTAHAGVRGALATLGNDPSSLDVPLSGSWVHLRHYRPADP